MIQAIYVIIVNMSKQNASEVVVRDNLLYVLIITHINYPTVVRIFVYENVTDGGKQSIGMTDNFQHALLTTNYGCTPAQTYTKASKEYVSMQAILFDSFCESDWNSRRNSITHFVHVHKELILINAH